MAGNANATTNNCAASNDEHAAHRANSRPNNALAESTIGQIKTELIYRRGPWRTVEQLKFARSENVDWWNHRRLHGEINMITPAQKEADYYPQTPDLAEAGSDESSLHRTQGGSPDVSGHLLSGQRAGTTIQHVVIEEWIPIADRSPGSGRSRAILTGRPVCPRSFTTPNRPVNLIHGPCQLPRPQPGASPVRSTITNVIEVTESNREFGVSVAGERHHVRVTYDLGTSDSQGSARVLLIDRRNRPAPPASSCEAAVPFGWVEVVGDGILLAASAPQYPATRST